jgi:hypothetical protein
VDLRVVEQSYIQEQAQELKIPIRTVSFTLNEIYLGFPFQNCPQESPKQGLEAEYGFPKSAMYLFHSCSSGLNCKTVASFAKWGPSIRCARQQGYFSRAPAVYWTSTLSFAIAWGIFSKYGSWDLSHRPGEPEFECLVYVAKVEWSSLNLSGGYYCIPVSSAADQSELVSVFY